MPRKNKKEYNEYMRNYMNKKQRELKGKPIFDNDFDPSSESGKPVLDVNKAGDLVKQTQDLLKNSKNASEIENDPFLKAINKYGKYIPLIVEFMKGIQSSASQFQQQNPTQKIQPPEGWLNMTPMTKLGYKHTRAEWYAAGEAYDIAIQTGQTNPVINTTYVDPTYSATPSDLRQLARKYPEPPIVKNDPAPEPEKVEEKKEEPDKSEQLVTELQQDNAKYVEMAINYINELSDEDLNKNLENVGLLENKFKPFFPLLPIQVKSMISQTSKEDLKKIIKEKCVDKFKIIEEKKKTKEILDLFEKLKCSI